MIAWFIAPYKRRLNETDPIRYCAMDDFTELIRADGGDWAESEVLGDRAIVKVRASATTLDIIAAAPGIKRLPKNRLDDSLSTLTNNQRNVIRNELQDMGYTLSEIQSRFGNDLSIYTLGDVIRFMATRRKKPRYDKNTDTIFVDGVDQPCRPIADIDGGVV